MSLAPIYEVRMLRGPLGYANYPRPCIVVSVRTTPTGALVAALSTKDLSEPGQSFCIPSTHPDFAATGLKSSSYTAHPLREVPMESLGAKRGVLQNELAREFKEWLG